MKKLTFFCLLSLYSTAIYASEPKAKEPERSVASQGRYICDIKNLQTSASTLPFAQVRNYLNNKCDPTMPFSVTSGAPNSYLVCCVAK